LKANEIAYNTAISACGKSAAWQAALELLAMADVWQELGWP